MAPLMFRPIGQRDPVDKKPYAAVSLCGEYNVCRVRTTGEWTFEAWRITRDSTGRILTTGLIRNRLPDYTTAKKTCEDYANAIPVRTPS